MTAGAAQAGGEARKVAGLQPPRLALFLLAQVVVLAAAAALFWRQGCSATVGRLLAPTLLSGGGGYGAGGPAALFRHTSNLSEWAAAPDQLAFLAPQSRCLLDPRGAVEVRRWRTPGATPFLFDTASMPDNRSSCAHCPPEHPAVPLCCGVCVFARRKCDDFYPGEGRSERVLAHLLQRGFPLQDFGPCELFARIRGRTLWVMGDSQMWNVYYALECLLREFAPHLRRAPALADAAEDAKLLTVTAPLPYRPLCLELALGSRVCGVRVDVIKDLTEVVLPTLQAGTPNFTRDVVLFNFGLHYPQPGAGGEAPGASLLWQGLARLAQWRRERLGRLPAMVWMDTPPQHFATRDGSWPGGQKPYTCAPLKAWFDGDPFVRAGGGFNAPIAPLVPHIADAHLRTWNATATLWGSHWPEECSHWCHPSAYQLWLLLLNDVLRDARLGSPVWVPERA